MRTLFDSIVLLALFGVYAGIIIVTADFVEETRAGGGRTLVMQFRRPTMSFFEHTWSFVESKRMQQGIHLKVRGEFMACVMATCFMHTHLGASISERMTASDASATGGGVGVASTISQEGNSY